MGTLLIYAGVFLLGVIVAAALLAGVGLVVWRKVMDRFMGYGQK